ncbi:MAG: hypothetical protein KBG48_21445 [Kofleriaceae bacterium]|nr:hypothetical protein [Kofleriaceae bacterium]MBP9169984.1 hypothetical protein [Kofleriaceae bacterium]
MKLSLVTVPAALAATAACGFAPTGDPATLTERLAGRATLAVVPGSQLDVTATSTTGATALAPEIVDGELVVRTTADGYLLVEKLTLPLADVTVPAGLVGPTPVTFTDLTVRLGTQLAIALPDPDAAVLAGAGRADLVLDWAAVLGGEVVPLGLRRLPRAPFTVAVGLDDDGALTAQLSTAVDGPAVLVAGGYQLRDLRLDVLGDAPLAR